MTQDASTGDFIVIDNGNDAIFRVPHSTADCNSNGVLDECDVAGIASQDCQLNTIPDECELSDNDCNSNSVPDDCEPDFDGDDLIDDCDDDIDNDGVANDDDVCNFTPLGAIIEPDGGILGDLDEDCDVDLLDYAIFQSRFTGSNG